MNKPLGWKKMDWHELLIFYEWHHKTINLLGKKKKNADFHKNCREGNVAGLAEV